MNTKRYFEFDGLRGLLALWVAVAHVLCWCGAGRIAGDGKAAKAWSIFTMADVAAETFIILSGFAIATLLRREKVSYGRYMTRRFFRIYPVYVLCLGLAIWLSPATGMLINQVPWANDFYMDWMRDTQANVDSSPAGHIGSHLFLVHGLMPKQLLAGTTISYLLPAWSIGLEEQFYLIAPFLMLALRSAKGRGGLVLLALLGQLAGGFFSNPMNCFVLAWLPYFMVGIASSYLLVWLDEDADRKRKIGGVVAFAAVAGALFLTNNKLTFSIWAVVCLVAAGAWQYMVPGVGTCIGAVLNCRLAQWFGQMSYSLYVLHWPLIIMLLGVIHRWRPETTQMETLGFMLTVGFSVILLLSWALHRAVELPLMRLGRRLATPGDSARAGFRLPAVL